MMKGKGRALGILEVCGYSTALIVINEMYRHMDIKVVAININKPAVAILEKIPLQAQVKFMGTLDQVKAALELGHKIALRYNETDDIISHCIPNPHVGIEKMINAWS